MRNGSTISNARLRIVLGSVLVLTGVCAAFYFGVGSMFLLGGKTPYFYRAAACFVLLSLISLGVSAVGARLLIRRV